MGYLKDLHGIQMVGNTLKGTCHVCAVIHNPGQPHNQQSLAYQYKFYDEYGKWPTWEDAMEHCSDEIKAFWKELLLDKGIEV